TYMKGLNGEELKGKSQVLEVLTLLHDRDEAAANKTLQSLLQAVRSNESEAPQENDDNGTEPKGNKSANLLMQQVQENALHFFKDQYGMPYVTIKVANHVETMPIQSKKSEYYVSKLYFDSTNGRKVAGSESVNNAIRVMHAQALFSGQERTLGLRLAWGKKNGEIYYDLGNSEWDVIKLTSANWSISKMSDAALFSRFNQKAQVTPSREYPPDIFDQYLDLMQIKNAASRLLIKVWTIALLIPDIPHPIAIIHGEKGGLKTTFCKYQKRLVDPDRIEVNNIPNEKAEFVQQMYHNYLAIYDNVKFLPPWFSDEVCKAVTGAGNSKRTLYTNDDDTIYDYKRCIMISGINNWLTEPDALDRSIIVELERPPDDLRKQETEVETKFEELRPRLFGYILDILVKTLQIKPEIKLTKLDRMADFEVWGEAIARAMGYSSMEFVDAYRENIGMQNIEAIENHQLAQVVIKFVDSWYVETTEACWQSPTSKVLGHLNKVAHAHNIDTTNIKAWPKAANSLTKKLKPILSNLRDGLGINITISRQTSGDKKKRNTSFIRITKTPPPSPPSPLKQQADGDAIGVEIGTSTISTEQQIAPLDNIQNHSRISQDGDSGASGDTFRKDDASIRNYDFLDNYVAFDLEWNIDTKGEKSIYAASFVDNRDKGEALHIADFDNSEQPLLQAVTKKIKQYPLSVGWNTIGTEQTNGTDSDLTVLNERFIKNSLPSIIGYSSQGLPFIEGHSHVDLYRVFRNKIIRTSVFNNRYRSLRLNDVATALLTKGKLEGVNGQNVHTKSIEVQKEYVLRDAELVMNLSSVNNGQILHLMQAIAQLTGLGLEQVCHSTISAWWSQVFADMGFAPTRRFSPSDKEGRTILRGNDYIGGKVIEPKKGVYHNLMIVDAVSLYPSMAILHNISFDTINCECCTERDDVKVPSEVLDKGYWICKQKDGVFPQKLREFRAERARQKELGNMVMQQVL
ncbi:MAG TPA: DNA polymerase domain-containing protein, partial [Nitrososphaeraceae archaeon]|nr:DNA polymerase domain-containing protein [Nitrososphaeraceae archaeon]